MGPKGDKGDTGLQGLKGDTGATGAKGDTGLQGIHGLKGDTGPQGLQGLKGDMGLRGLQGERGPVGFNASNSLIERVTMLEQHGLDFRQQQRNGSLLTGFAPSPGVTVIGNSTFVFGDTVFLGSPTTVAVTEVGENWEPNSVTVSVGDNVTWTWSSNTSVTEVQVTNANSSLVGGVFLGHFVRLVR